MTDPLGNCDSGHLSHLLEVSSNLSIHLFLQKSNKVAYKSFACYNQIIRKSFETRRLPGGGAAFQTFLWKKEAKQMPYMDAWDSSLNPPAKAIYFLLQRYADNTTHHCWPSIGTLVVKSGFSRPTVKKALRELVLGKWLIIRPRIRKDHGRSSNDYELLNPLGKQHSRGRQAEYPEAGKEVAGPRQADCPELNQITNSVNYSGNKNKSRTPKGFASLGIDFDKKN